jgi:glycosidase
MLTWFTSNHDENSWNGTEYQKYGDMAKLLSVFNCTWNGIPLIYSGQELPNKKRLKFFDKDEIEWTGNEELHGFYKTLLQLHSSHPALRAGDRDGESYILKTNNEKNCLAFLRRNGDREVLVILNFSREISRVMLNDNKVSGQFRNVFTNLLLEISPFLEFVIDPWDFFVLEK